MKNSLFMKADEVAQVLEVSVPYAYKLIRKLNRELEEKGCMVISGRVDRRYFYERFYGGVQLLNETKEEKSDVGIQG